MKNNDLQQTTNLQSLVVPKKRLSEAAAEDARLDLLKQSTLCFPKKLVPASYHSK